MFAILIDAWNDNFPSVQMLQFYTVAGLSFKGPSLQPT